MKAKKLPTPTELKKRLKAGGSKDSVGARDSEETTYHDHSGGQERRGNTQLPVKVSVTPSDENRLQYGDRNPGKEHGGVKMNERLRLEVTIHHRRKIAGKESGYHGKNCKERKEHVKHAHLSLAGTAPMRNGWLNG